MELPGLSSFGFLLVLHSVDTRDNHRFALHRRNEESNGNFAVELYVVVVMLFCYCVRETIIYKIEIGNATNACGHSTFQLPRLGQRS